MADKQDSMASEFVSVIKRVLLGQWDEELTTIVFNKLNEVKNVVCLWSTYICASHREEVAVILLQIGNSVMTHGTR